MSHYFTVLIGAFTLCFGLLDARHYSERLSRNDHNTTLISNLPVYSGEATYYDPSVGACGFSSGGNELVCAIADSLYDTKTINGNPNNNRFCGRQIAVTGPNGMVIVTIVDRCGSCRGGDLDLSRPAFNQIGDPINGRVPITWRFI